MEKVKQGNRRKLDPSCIQWTPPVFTKPFDQEDTENEDKDVDKNEAPTETVPKDPIVDVVGDADASKPSEPLSSDQMNENRRSGDQEATTTECSNTDASEETEHAPQDEDKMDGEDMDSALASVDVDNDHTPVSETQDDESTIPESNITTEEPQPSTVEDADTRDRFESVDDQAGKVKGGEMLDTIDYSSDETDDGEDYSVFHARAAPSVSSSTSSAEDNDENESNDDSSCEDDEDDDDDDDDEDGNIEVSVNATDSSTDVEEYSLPAVEPVEGMEIGETAEDESKRPGEEDCDMV